MTIRIAHIDDIDALFDIRTSVAENYQSREEIAALGITPASVATMLETDCRAWIAQQRDTPAGFAIANATAQTIFGLFVRPEFENQGLGRALMDAAERWLWTQGAVEIWLLTENNPAFRAYGFYLHLGWRPVGVEADGTMKFTKRSPIAQDTSSLSGQCL